MANGEVSKEFILERLSNRLGSDVVICEEARMEELARKAATICRRRFKAQDVICLSLLDEEGEGEAGVAFTSKGLYYWSDGDRFLFSVKYAEIRSVDYDDDGVLIEKDYKEENAKEEMKERFLSELRNHHASPLRIGCMNPKEGFFCIPCAPYDCDEDEERVYIREMYNIIADIVEEVIV